MLSSYRVVQMEIFTGEAFARIHIMILLLSALVHTHTGAHLAVQYLEDPCPVMYIGITGIIVEGVVVFWQ